MSRHLLCLFSTLPVAAAATVATAWIGSISFRPERAVWAESPETITTALVRREVLSATLMSDRAGWPLYALACEFDLASSPRGELFAYAVHGGLPIDLPPPVFESGFVAIRPAAAYARAIPLRPLATGFLINTAIYFAAIQGAAFLTAAIARRRALSPRAPSRAS